MIREHVRTVSSGYLMLVVLAAGQLGFAYLIFRSATAMSLNVIFMASLASVVVAI